MPVVLKNIRVWALERNVLFLSWEIEETVEDLVGYTVTILRSESEGGPFLPVSRPMIAQDTHDFADRSVNTLSKWREFCYRLRLTKVADGSYVDFGTNIRGSLDGSNPGSASLEAPPDLEALEAIRRFDLVLREYGGRQVLVLTERTFGTRCPVCWDELKRKVNRSDCRSCFGTGFAGGFYRPVLTRCIKPPSDALTALGIMEQHINEQTMWFSAHPRLKNRDLVISIDGRRWRTEMLRPSEKGWATTRQTVKMTEISRDQSEYDIPISKDDWKVDNLTAGPLRQHIRATDIDSYHQAVRNLGLDGSTIFPEKGEIATDPENSDAEDA